MVADTQTQKGSARAMARLVAYIKQKTKWRMEDCLGTSGREVSIDAPAGGRRNSKSEARNLSEFIPDPTAHGEIEDHADLEMRKRYLPILKRQIREVVTQQLSPQQMCILRRDVQGIWRGERASGEEIAEQLSTTPEAIKSQRWRINQKFVKNLKVQDQNLQVKLMAMEMIEEAINTREIEYDQTMEDN